MGEGGNLLSTGQKQLISLARAVLADRFWCRPLQELRDKLGDPEADVRRATATVCRQRKLKALTPELIGLLADENTDLAKLAHQVLQQFAAPRDFGPRKGANPEERLQAMSAWRDWWEAQNRKSDKP